VEIHDGGPVNTAILARRPTADVTNMESDTDTAERPYVEGITSVRYQEIRYKVYQDIRYRLAGGFLAGPSGCRMGFSRGG
jgi:hypothetical protein